MDYHANYEIVMPGAYKITPCTCNQCMQEGQVQERFELFLNRLNDQYIQNFGKPAPSWVAYQEMRCEK